MMTPAACPTCCRLLVAPADRTLPPVVAEQCGDRERVLLRGVFESVGRSVNHA